MRAPWITAWPTPPHPMTATDDPGSTWAVLSAAPTPVVTPQPISASWSSGRSVVTRTAWCSATVMSSAKVPRPVNAVTGVPSARDARGVTIICMVSSHRFERSCRQNQQAPQEGTNVAMTLSPLLTRVTSAPTQSTVPAASCPRIVGGGRGRVPLVAERSEWHTPLAPIVITTSCGPGTTGSSSSISSGWSWAT